MTASKQEIQPEMKSDDIMSSFTSQGDKSEIAEVLKELFDKKKIYMISDLTPDEIRLITRLQMVAKMKNIKAWQQGVNMFIELMISKNRQSRKEIIEAVRGFNMKKQMTIPSLFGGNR